MLTGKQSPIAAATFASCWTNRGYEKGESQSFWTGLLSSVFGTANYSDFIQFEVPVKIDDSTHFIDTLIPSTHVLIEQKSLGIDLRKHYIQSDKKNLTPYQQAKRYVSGLPISQHPRWIITCNFQEFLIYDIDHPNAEPESILRKDLGKKYYRLKFIVAPTDNPRPKEERVSIEAGKIVIQIYNALRSQYADQSPQTLRWLNILCVRLVFCFYAEDAEVCGRNQFHDYLFHREPKDLRRALLDLFDVLNTPEADRDPYLPDDRRAFPYTNSSLFAEKINIPQFTPELKMLLLSDASSHFDWSEISPTIFGFIFEGTLDPSSRRDGGMHYTSIENIHKVIDPLFLDDLRHELDTILDDRIERSRNRRLDAYRHRLSTLYDDTSMPSELRHAHRQNDRAVMAAYGFDPDMSESQCVAELFRLYQPLTQHPQ